jgi:hypothetical protein
LTTDASRRLGTMADGFAAVATILDARESRADEECALFTAAALVIQLRQHIQSHPGWALEPEEYRQKIASLLNC